MSAPGKPHTFAGADLERRAAFLEFAAVLVASVGLGRVGVPWRRRAAELRAEWRRLERSP